MQYFDAFWILRIKYKCVTIKFCVINNLSLKDKKMKIYKAIVLSCLSLILFNSSLSAATDISKLNAIYEKEIEKIGIEYISDNNEWPEKYLKSLKILQNKAQKDGKLDDWQLINNETTRFSMSKTISTEALAQSPASLLKLQKQYINIQPELDLTKHKKVYDLTKKYTSRLSTLQKSLTQNGKIEDAIKIKEEIAKVNARREVVEANLAIKENTKSDNAETPVADKKEETPPPSMEINLPNGYTAYQDKPPSTINGLNPSKASLKPTTAAGISRAANCELYLASDSESKSKSGVGIHTVHTAERDISEYGVRLNMKASGETLRNTTIAVEYFGTQSGSGTLVPQVIRTDTFHLPALTGSKIYVDLPKFTIHKDSVTHAGFRGHTTKEKTGMSFYGLSVSIFKDDGSFAYQGITQSNLKDYALKSMPADNFRREEFVDKPMQPQENLGDRRALEEEFFKIRKEMEDAKSRRDKRAFMEAQAKAEKLKEEIKKLGGGGDDFGGGFKGDRPEGGKKPYKRF